MARAVVRPTIGRPRANRAALPLDEPPSAPPRNLADIGSCATDWADFRLMAAPQGAKVWRESNTTDLSCEGIVSDISRATRKQQSDDEKTYRPS